MTLPLPPGFPRTFGPYLLLGPLAQGGMGEVFLASTMGVSGAVKLVVIKTLRPDLAKEPGYVTRFLDEARIVIQLSHSNICQVFDVGCHDGVHFFAMEHIAGTNLRRLLDASLGMIPTPLALLIAADALDGLDAAHRHRHALTGEPMKVVHRDVSPHNIMLSFEGEVKLIDFGLAASELKQEHTGSQVVLGKIAYMSPEQARGELVDARSDQFSLAIVLYELLAGERYYGERTQREIWQIAGSRYVPTGLGIIDPELAAVIGRALAFEPHERFESCGDFAAALRTVLKLKFPFCERSTLRSFIRETLVDDRAETEETLRVFGQAALLALPEASVSASVPSAPMTTSLPSSPAVTRGWQPALLAAAAGLALGALGVFIALSITQATPKAEAVASTPPSLSALASDAGVPPSIARPNPTPAPTTSATSTTTATTATGTGTSSQLAASAPMADETPTSIVAPVPTASASTGAVSRWVRRARRTDPAWERLSLDEKLNTLSKCSQTCAKSLRKMKSTDPGAILTASVESCHNQCS